jgi:hypothetical protein
VKPYLLQIADECQALAEQVSRMERSKRNLQEAIQALCFKVGCLATYLDSQRRWHGH